MDLVGGIAVWVGFLALLAGVVWFVIAAFREHVLWGLGVLFVPLVPLIYLVLGWPEAKRPFFLQLLGIVLVLVGALVLAAPLPWRH